ncbi:NADH-quinone oxidoreductase subunit C [Streptomyces sp. NPDC048291]|uniref:NADH-quinone oxidoreductase subunit C n=1 Tax=Streptomyces sp. NPDC048291 TaxID=3365530 RepID=UPI0037136A6D
MTAPPGWLPAPVEELFGTDATADESYDVLTVDVPPSSWLAALETARTTLSCTYFDWLSAVDEPGTGFRVCAHVVALAPVRRLLLRTTVPHTAPELPSAVGVYAGARWHERETHEMFGVRFTGHPGLDHLLLPENFEGHPLRKDFVLAARVAKAWPGAKEPGESEHGGPKRRQMLPPGVPDPNEWGPLKGQLPAAPARPARTAPSRTTGDRPPRPPRAADDRPARRSRTAAEGSTSQATEATEAAKGAEGAEVTAESGAAAAAGPPAAPRGPRRTRTASGGSASQRAEETETPTTPARPAAPRSSDAPWHHARPAFEEPEAGTPRETTADPAEGAGTGTAGTGTKAEEPGAGTEPGTGTGTGTEEPVSAAPEAPVAPVAPEAPEAQPTAHEDSAPEPSTPEAPASEPPPEAPASEAPAPEPAPEAPPREDPAPEHPAAHDDPPGGPQ